MILCFLDLPLLKELQIVTEQYGWGINEVLQLQKNAVAAAFCTQEEKRKTVCIHRCISEKSYLSFKIEGAAALTCGSSFYISTQNAELRKARRSWYNQFMRLNKNNTEDYPLFSLYYQIKLPLDLEISIPSDDPVRLVSAFVEEMDLSELYKTYGRIRKNQATPRQMLKLVIYAAMNRIYSSRDIRKIVGAGILFRKGILTATIKVVL